MLVGLYIAILIFAYVFQQLVFKKKWSEVLVSWILWIVCTAYVVASIILVRKLEIPFVLTGFLNLYTVSLLLKVISYSHVLNNVRYYINAIENEKNEDILEEIVAEVSKPVN